MPENNNNENNINIFDGGDFVYTETPGENGEPQIIAGGYKINSFFLEKGLSHMMTSNTKKDGGNQDVGNQDVGEQEEGNQDGGEGKVSSPFEYLAVPAGLFYINTRETPKEKDIKYTSHTIIDDDIYDKLFSLIQETPKKNKKYTRHHKDIKDTKNKNKKTRKHTSSK